MSTTDETLQRFYASLAPGAAPFDPGAPDRPETALEPSVGAMSGIIPFAQTPIDLPRPKQPWDGLVSSDRKLAEIVYPEVFLEPAEFLDKKREPLQKPLGFWESAKLGFTSNTLGGVFLSHQRLKSEIMALPGELEPVPGFDPLRDPVARKLISEAGLESELWSFRDATSPNEVLFRIKQYQARQQDAALMERASGAGVLLGSFADPTTIFPIVGAQSAVVKGFWGTMWRGGRAAAINASYALAQEGLMADYDASYRSQGILDAMEIPAALGFAVGVIHSRTARHKETFNPKQPFPPKAPAPEKPISGRLFPDGPPVERPDFRDWKSANKMPEAEDGVVRGFHGTTTTYDDYDPAKLGDNTGAQSARMGFFFASNPETASTGYANMHEVLTRSGGGVTIKRNSLWQRVLGKGKVTEIHHPVEHRSEWVGEGAQVRPTYLRMNNPYEVVDREPVQIHADWEHSGEVWIDANGNAWRGRVLDNPYDIGVDFEGNPTPDQSPRQVPSWEPVKKDERGRYVSDESRDEMDVIEHMPQERQINYADEIARAKEAGHDGVIIRQTRDAGLEGTDVYVVFDKENIRHFDERYAVTPEEILKSAPPHPTDVAEHGAPARSLSSAAPIQATTQLPYLLEQEALKETGVGLENLPMNPSLRLLQSMSLRARQLVTEMIDLGGMKQNKNIGPFAEATTVPVESEIARVWKPKAIQALNDIQAAWLEARGAIDGALPTTMSATAWTGMKTQARDWIMRERGLTWYAFDDRVAKAMRRGDKDAIHDAYTPFVEKAALAGRKFHDDLKNAGMDPNVDIFGKANRKLIETLQKEVAALKAKGLDATQSEGRLQKAISQQGQAGKQTTALSYFTRYWNVDALMKGKDKFLFKVENYFVGKGVQQPEARKSALAIYKTLTGAELRTIDEAADEFAAVVGDPMSAKMRSLEIPDIEIEEFLESSVSLSIRHQLATFAPAIEMHRRFGDTSMARAIETIQEDYKKLHEAAEAMGDAPLMQKLKRQEKQDVEDVKTLRDRLLNVAGASKDPHSWDQRTIRMLKHYMTWTTMGLSAFSQLGDLLRPAITEGLDAMHRYGFASLISDSRKTIWELAERERFLAGDSLEVVLASKAMAAADIGDVFASRSNWERKAGQFTNAYYMLNGMNHAVDLSKTWASIIVQSNINDAIYKWGMHILDPKLNAAPDKLMMERLQSLSIGGNDALRMAQELAGKGLQFKSVHLANTENWADLGARDLYRQALQRALQRTVVTPGLGDKPTWMSTPLGSLIGQFKSFGVSSTIRTLYAGLQDKDRNFFMGAAVLVGGGIVLNEIRAQAFSGKSSTNQPYLGILMDAVDRSGVLGSFTDVNNAVEAASNNKLGARPLLGAGRKYPVTGDRLVGAFLGPSAGQAVLAANTLGRIVNGDPTARTMRQARQFVPLQNHFAVKAPESLLSR